MGGLLNYFRLAACLPGLIWAISLQISAAPPLPAQWEAYQFVVSETDSSEIIHFASNKLAKLRKQGFLKAEWNLEQSADGLNFTLSILPGPQFFYRIESTNVSPLVISELNISEQIDGNQISFKQFGQLSDMILNWYANNGYPFARLYKHEITFTDEIILMELRAETMELIVFDTLRVKGDLNINNRFLENHTEIIPGNPFSEQLVNELELKLRELDFISLSGPIELGFTPGTASLHLPLQKAQANRFDGIVGLAGGETPEPSMFLTGSLNLYLANALGRGEHLEMGWQGPGKGSQLLEVSAGHPYIFNLPLNAEVMFLLHRRDTSWIQLQFRPALLFRTASHTQWGAFWQHTTASLISTSQYQHAETIPENLDFALNLYGIEFRKSTPAFNRELLQRGYRLKASAAAGRKKTIRNTNIPQQVYENIEPESLHMETRVKNRSRIKISQVSTLEVDFNLAWTYAKDMTDNQLHRLGGFTSLKGFDELSLTASSFALSALEYRYFIAPASFLSLFINGGWYERRQKDRYFKDFPVGAGGGLNLETQAGIFAIYFALGQKKNTPAEFRNTKIHVGYISTF